MWSENQSYLKAKDIVEKLFIVNDTCERSVAITKFYSNTLSKNNNNINTIVQLMEDDRKHNKKATKLSYSM